MRAIEVDGLVRKFGDFTAVDGGRSTSGGRGLRLPGAERRRQDHHHQHAVHAARSPPPARRRQRLRRRRRSRTRCGGSIGLVFQDPTLDDRLTAHAEPAVPRDALRRAADVVDERIARVLDMVDLTDTARRRPCREYSGGMKRRLEIARGLLHHPRVLFLDEPTIGLDPQTRSTIWEYVRELRERGGLTIFLTTHYMDEAENCDRIAIIDHGKIIAAGHAREPQERWSAATSSRYAPSDNESASAILAAGRRDPTRIGPEASSSSRRRAAIASSPRCSRRARLRTSRSR